MVQILLDECLPVKLEQRFEEANDKFQVATVSGEGWSGIKDRQLLDQAQKQFDVFITIDKNLAYQQQISSYDLAVLVLESNTNRYKDLLKFVEPAAEKIKTAEQGAIYRILG